MFKYQSKLFGRQSCAAYQKLIHCGKASQSFKNYSASGSMRIRTKKNKEVYFWKYFLSKWQGS